MPEKKAQFTRLSWFLGVTLLACAAALLTAQALDSPKADPVSSPPAPSAKLFSTTIHQPDAPPAIDTGEVDEMGQPIFANCTTCHATKPPNPRLTDGDQLKSFHQGLTTNHGTSTCLTCHHAQDYGQLRLADGRPLAFEQVMTLCAQCHGPQFKDYQHGAHGGMTGYWDLTRGPRQRNTCTDCHDPHAPQYPKMMPVLPPNDRFLRTGPSENAHE